MKTRLCQKPQEKHCHETNFAKTTRNCSTIRNSSNAFAYTLKCHTKTIQTVADVKLGQHGSIQQGVTQPESSKTEVTQPE